MSSFKPSPIILRGIVPFFLIFLVNSSSFASPTDSYKQLSCNPESENSGGALLRANFYISQDEAGNRVVADIKSLMLVSNGERKNADENFQNSFWGEEKNGRITIEPNNDGSEQSKISKLEIVIDEHQKDLHRGTVITKDKKTYAMNCSVL